MENINSQSGNSVKLAVRVSVITIIVNTALAAFKLAAGIIANSAAMVSDAVHTLSDVLTTFIVIIGVKMAGQKSDDLHPYGHERFECVASIILALSLGVVGVGIGYSGIKVIFSGNEPKTPEALALIAAVVSIVTKEWMYWYTRAAAKKTNSGSLLADAWHHRSDALSSIGVFIGIGGAMMGWPVLDPIASLVICVLILKAAYDIFTDAINKMVDKSCDADTQNELQALAKAQDGVRAVDEIRTRIFGSMIYVDIEIAVDKDMPLTQAHKIAEKVHDAIEERFPSVKHCMVHVNPHSD